MICRRHFLTAIAGTALCPPHVVAEDRSGVETVAAGRKFLAGLFDPGLALLPEYRGAETYWLYHDNYLAAKVLRPIEPRIADRIDASIRGFGVTGSGKIEIATGEAKQPLPFRQYELVEVARRGRKVVRTERVTGRPLAGWEEYADLLLLAAIARAKENPDTARGSFDAAATVWDGKGFADRVVRMNGIYATYKLALALLAARALGVTPGLLPAVRQRLLAMQNEEGGWITDYRPDLTAVGLANAETTSLAILALDPPA